MGKVSINTQATIHIITRGPIINPRKLTKTKKLIKSILKKRINKIKMCDNDIPKKKQESHTIETTTVKI